MTVYFLNRCRSWKEQEHGTHDDGHDDEDGYAQGLGLQVPRYARRKSSVRQQTRLPVGHHHRAEEAFQSTETRHVRGCRSSTPRVSRQ